MKKLLFFILFCPILNAQNTYKHQVFFDTDEYAIKPSEDKKFNRFLARLDSVYIDKITIYGFCDDRGTPEYNLSLSKRRATAVKLLFIDNEVSEKLITILDGKGELALSNDSVNVKAVRQMNRRVDVLVKTRLEKETDRIEIPTTQEILQGELHVGDKIRLKNIYFKTGYSRVVPESIETLKEIADILAEKDNVYFTIQGHVCCTHDTYDAVDRNTNKRNLSVARAKFIYNYFLRRGIEKHRMRYVGLRRKYPLGGDPKYDRRVEIEITHIAEKN